jgi:hypothetical protein
VKRLRTLEEAILARPEILECHVVSGDADFLLRVVVPDMAAYERFHRDFLVRVAGVSSTVSSVALKQVKDVVQLPLEALSSERGPESKNQTSYRPHKKTTTRSGAPDARVARGAGGRNKILNAASTPDRSYVA